MTTPTANALAQIDALRPEAIADTLSELVATRSVNGVDGEAAIAERVRELLRDTRCEVSLVETLPGRPSVAAVLRGREQGPRLVLNGHMDTVGPGEPEQWTADPFGGEQRDGFVWGRGATDMKGGLACQIACARALSSLEPLAGSLILHFAVGEERGEPGTRSLIEAGYVGDWGIVTEPTDLRVAVAQRGTAWFRATIAGRATHAGTRDEGVNATIRLPALIDALIRHDECLRDRTHPLVGRALCTPTIVRSGGEPNVIPELAEVIVDRRMVPGESSAGALRELEQVIEELNATEPGRPYAIEPHLFTFEPAEVPADTPFVRRVQRAAGEVGSHHEGVWATPWGSDVTALVNEAGMEAVTFGPGDPNGAHGLDERCSIERLHQCAVALTAIAVDLLGG